MSKGLWCVRDTSCMYLLWCIACPDPMMTKISLKVVVLSAGELVCSDHPLSTMLLYNLLAVLEVFVQQYVFMGADKVTFTEACSFYTHRIYLHEFTLSFLRKTDVSPVRRHSPYLPAAIVCIHICFVALTHMSSLPSHWWHLVSSSTATYL